MRIGNIRISKDKDLLEQTMICDFLKDSYWAKNRTNEQIRKSIENSICFGVYEGPDQIGFARVISDQSTFAYIADVFIVDQRQGQGYARSLMKAILSDRELKTVPNWYLITKDAQNFYHKFDFEEYSQSEKTIMHLGLKTPLNENDKF